VHDMQATPFIKPLWSMLLLIAILLFPFEIFVRRVMVPWGLIFNALFRYLQRIPGVRSLSPKPKRQALAVTGAISTGAVARDFSANADLYNDDAYDALGGDAPETAAAEGSADAKSTPAAKPEMDYTQKLLEAKEKARKRKQQRIDRLDDE
jgi:hypothetical protein